MTRFHRRTGVSEVMAAVVTIAITLVAGAALFGYVNGEAASNENSLGINNAKNVNFLNEKFDVVDFAIQPSGSVAELWIYNSGSLTLQLSQIAIYQGNNKTQFYSVFTNDPGGSGCTSATGIGAASYLNQGTPTSFSFANNTYAGTEIASGSSPLGITLTLPSNCHFAQATTYYASVVGLYGNTVVYPECDSPSGCPL